MRIPERMPRGRRDLRIPYFDEPTNFGEPYLDPGRETSGHHAIGPLMLDVDREDFFTTKALVPLGVWEDHPAHQASIEQEWWQFVARERICVTQAPRTLVQPYFQDHQRLAALKRCGQVSLGDSPTRQVEVVVEGYGRRVLR